ncbi:hypothetical protein [Catenulispora acidiphila]|uniref:hypothetical protein n=1 Tax=Catenulispora acidiphila TaxID=304895 RepID=UPI001CBDF9C3|nr:hypothetical protein [Catenulispora acidiphila]
MRINDTPTDDPVPAADPPAADFDELHAASEAVTHTARTAAPARVRRVRLRVLRLLRLMSARFGELFTAKPF